MRIRKGFTLIELLVVIAIIGLIATISVVTLQYTRERARIAQARNSLKLLEKLYMAAQQEQSAPIVNITLNGCTDCSCRTSTDMRNTTGPCYTDWETSLNRVKAAASGAITAAPEVFLRDPWGSPYSLDENEREFSPADCRPDTFRSLGPDGIYNTVDDINLDGTAYLSPIPYSRPCP
ncbi:MAG: type II secretion system GspH family protein [Candidatus Uhrbacteria bacterium]|nr:type II secretion system GspH family protein [Candidatus Uhrbacteria bacterium]